MVTIFPLFMTTCGKNTFVALSIVSFGIKKNDNKKDKALNQICSVIMQ